MDQNIPLMLHPLLQEYADRVERQLPGRITAFYLEGSIALGEFDPRLSDIDFIAVLKSKAALSDFENISHIHRTLERKYPWKMSGMYLQAQELGCEERTSEPFPAYHDGKPKWSDYFALSSVTWWILKNHGITVFGIPAQSLEITVDMEHLIQIQRNNLNTYWVSWTRRPGRVVTLLSDWGIQWTVLGVLRQFYTLRENMVTSKIKAGEYALSVLPERWHPIIEEAIALRKLPGRSDYHSRIKRAYHAFYFLQHVIASCNQFTGSV
jgi:hypothetical protein